MIILVDQDGVLADYNKTLYERWKKAHPDEFEKHHIPLEEVTIHDLSLLYSKNIQKHIREIEQSPGFFGELKVIHGAIEAMYELVRLGHEVCICTRPSKRAFEQCALDKLKWVKRHLGEAYIERMMIVRDKTFGYGDILIDDKPEVKGVLNPHWEHVLYSQPYNQEVKGKHRISWDGNWKEVIDEIEEKIAKNRR